jgi:hypothetical protein
LFLLSIYLFQQSRSKPFGTLTWSFEDSFARPGYFRIKNLGTHFHPLSIDGRQHSYRLVAIGAQQPQELAFRSQTNPGIDVAYWLEQHFQSIIPAPYLDRDYPLSTRRYENLWCQKLGGKLVPLKGNLPITPGQTEPVQASAGKDDGVPFAFGELTQTRRDVAAKIDNRQVRTFPAQLMPSADAASGDNPVRRQRIQIAWRPCDQDIVHRRARKHCRDLGTRSQTTRHIFRAMNGKIDILRHQSVLDFSREQALTPPSDINKPAFVIISARPDYVDFDFQIRPALLQPLDDQMRLAPC